MCMEDFFFLVCACTCGGRYQVFFSPPPKYIFYIKIYIYLCIVFGVCVWGHVNTMANVQRSLCGDPRRACGGSLLSFDHVGLRVSGLITNTRVAILPAFRTGFEMTSLKLWPSVLTNWLCWLASGHQGSLSVHLPSAEVKGVDY